MSTIAAISSPLGAGGIGIVRVSGEEALSIADAIFSFHKRDKNEWKPMTMHYGVFDAGDFRDNGYAVYFPAARAYTGEDTVEFYLHGGVRVLQGALDALLAKGARLAEAGEFTRRAFLSGRLSLADAEGVIDMINADSAAGLRAAYRLMDGEVAVQINAIADSLEEVIAGLEATLDYPEETEDEVLPSLPQSVMDCLDRVNALIATARQGKIAKYGLRVVLAGSANAGKSSLLNAMLGENRAIVTSVPGTTRDTIEAELEWNGVKIVLVDTAGLRESDDAIEAEGVRRAQKELKGADVVLHVIDRSQPEDGLEFGDSLVFDVYAKSDINGRMLPRKAHCYLVSALKKEGIKELLDAIAGLYRGASAGGEIITNERHISALYQAQKALKTAFLHIDDTADCILVDLREAYDALGKITGKTATEDIVNAVFSRFCVGK